MVQGSLFDLLLSQAYLAHSVCLTQDPGLIWLHAGADALTAAAYYSIPFALIAFALRRKDLRFRWVFLLFGAFILACGTTHLLGVVTLWYPVYWLQGVVKALNAIVSVATAVALWPLMPRLLALPSPDDLRQANAALAAEVAERQAAEQHVRSINASLERRVQDRTRGLEAANAALRASKRDSDIANRAKSDFLANMSHELRTPLNAIIGFAQAMRDGLFGPLENPRYQSYIDDIHGSGLHLLALINDILDVSKIEAGKVALDEEEVDPLAIARAVERMTRERAQDNGVRLSVDEAAWPRARVMADSRRLKQVLLNLVFNAIKFTEAGGSVTVAAARLADGGLAITVTDTGIGIAPEDLMTVLSPFGQVDTRLSRRYEGAGLGLPLSKSLMELHGGRLDLDSTPRVGTTATIVLPARRVLAADNDDRWQANAFARPAPG